ncbi:ABC transporter substrate-binding protein [Saccharopolyspora sp. K220]|uniref:ABC transporter substrate-binding protein n=1 Tax=Saccharopolyspora soli TaxID=2926618 RepID=UPI001F55C60A|nr:ABC transporter substrate-binding protein [Saccharopolyspora soli]MCI2419555.1 ABC transporter substrate-binding protein [Saccharopolyspora soli]
MWMRSRLSGAVTAVVVVLSTALVMTGCGAVGQNSEPKERTVQSTNPYGGNFAAEGTPKRGGTLLLGEDREIVSFDPTVQNTNMAASAVYDSLMRLGPGGKVEPYLAQSMDSPDSGLTWRLVLRPGVKFSDGTDLDANAVIVNVQRHIDKVSSPAHALTERIKSMRAVDPLTVEFDLAQPTGDFPTGFAQPFFGGTLGMIVSPAALQKYGKDIGSNPVGAGPFKFVSWVRDSKLVLARNPGYWQAGKPYLDGLEFRPLPDTESRYASIQNGDVDLIFGGYITELSRAAEDPRLTVYYGSGNGAEWLYFNFTRAPFNDRRMREAIIRGLDIRALSASQYRNQLEPAASLFGDDSQYHAKAASDAWPTYDPEKAKQLVKDYVATGGDPNFTFKTTNAPNRVAFGEFVQAQMAAIGIKVDLQYYDLAQFSSSVVQSSDFQLTSWVGGPFDSAYPAAQRLLGSRGSGNYGKYSNPKMDDLLNQAISTSDPAQRNQIYQQVELLANQDLALGWYSRGYLSTITKPEVKGIDRYVSRDMFYATTWLDR